MGKSEVNSYGWKEHIQCALNVESENPTLEHCDPKRKQIQIMKIKMFFLFLFLWKKWGNYTSLPWGIREWHSIPNFKKKKNSTHWHPFDQTLLKCCSLTSLLLNDKFSKLFSLSELKFIVLKFKWLRRDLSLQVFWYLINFAF